jgi:hypothetical protein
MVQKKNPQKLYILQNANLKSYKNFDRSLFGLFPQCFVDRNAERVQGQEC